MSDFKKRELCENRRPSARFQKEWNRNIVYHFYICVSHVKVFLLPCLYSSTVKSLRNLSLVLNVSHRSNTHTHVVDSRRFFFQSEFVQLIASRQRRLRVLFSFCTIGFSNKSLCGAITKCNFFVSILSLQYFSFQREIYSFIYTSLF